MDREPLKSLEQLGDELERVARADARRPRRLLRRRVRLLAVIAPLTLAGAAGALAAGGVLKGDPVPSERGIGFKLDEGLGAPVKGSMKLLGLRVPDPDGGLPWGLRTVKTTRGLACVQVGRVREGELGVLGRDGVFANDGRFHELPDDRLTGDAHCQLADARGHLFIAINFFGMAASGPVPGCTSRRPPAVTAKDLGLPSGTKPPPPLPLCAPRSMRTLQFGLLGPRGTAVTYKDAAGRPVRSAAEPGTGAYLVVRRKPRARRQDGWTPSVTPRNGLVSVSYAGAPDCVIPDARRIGGSRPCPAVGYVEPVLPTATSAQVRTPIGVAVSRKAVVPEGSDPKYPVPPMREVTLTFRARQPVDARRTFVIQTDMRLRVAAGVRRPRQGRCSGFMTLGSVQQDRKAGEIVTSKQYVHPSCEGTLRGTVRYQIVRGSSNQSGLPLGPEGGLDDGAFVGRFAVTIRP